MGSEYGQKTRKTTQRKLLDGTSLTAYQQGLKGPEHSSRTLCEPWTIAELFSMSEKGR